ncbi:hypothetical protein ACFY00_32930 [Kitasatospora sp. NPDC001540]|uniref:hypothetical protein n=1 Tax=Kitasatospora sp. NPDC001540 TaxID=3364014 RepID=UPI0036BAA79E
MRALVEVGAGLSDAAQLLRVVVAAKARHDAGCVARLRVPELARWMGVGNSTVDKALAELRRAGALYTVERRAASGAVTGLDCRVPGLRAAAAAGTDPLALTRAELATLLRLVERLFGPGWEHQDGTRTLPGLLASRVGRGAATDRLALVLLVLEARADGRVRLCGGAVNTRVGRPAVTVARLVGSGIHAGARVLARLQRAGVLELVRKATASGLAARGEIRIPAVASAHRAVSGTGACRRAISDPALAAVRGQCPAAADKSQVAAGPEAHALEAAEPDGTADLHTTHTPVVAAGVEGGGTGVVSGEAALGSAAVAGGARGRARTGAGPVRLASGNPAGAGALRAEGQTPTSSPDAGQEQRAGGARPGGWRQESARSRVRTALAPVAFVLDAMTPGQRAVAVRAAEVVLCTVAPESLAAQLAARVGPMSMSGPLEDRGVIRSPLAWLLSQLPSVTLCGRCGIRGTAGAPSARSAVCDQCVAHVASVREDGARICPVCGHLGERLGEGGQCGRCEHRQVLERAGDWAAEAAEAAQVHRPGARADAGAVARRAVLDAAREAAAEAERQGADQLLQEFAARLAAQNTAAEWASGCGSGGRAGRAAPRAEEPEGWRCADARCARRSTARRPDSGLCSSCDRAREHREARAARVARMAAAVASAPSGWEDRAAREGLVGPAAACSDR